MANAVNLTPYRPGESGNPGGKPKAARNRIQGKFLNALADDFDQHGAQAIVACRESDPSRYLSIVASLVPKQIEAAGPLEHVSDDELQKWITRLRAQEQRTDTDEE